MRKRDIPEILAPVGSKEAFYSAIAAGCDALYLGGKAFGARAYANNFSTEELTELIRYAHFFDVQVYYTLNTLVKDIEIEDLKQVLDDLKLTQVDAVIIQDLGVYGLIRDKYPDFVVHGSTQMNLHSVDDAKLARDMGFDRLVLSRECSLKDIRKIKDQVDIEIEAFVHGALCYCYSGQCLMSSIYGGRSGNRGKCAQPCRLPYDIDGESAYFLSPKDQMTLQLMPELIKAGVDSFKIEGRMKGPEYVYATVVLYKKYRDLALTLIDTGEEHDFKIDKKDIDLLNQLFNRGHFTDGYYSRHNGQNMISYDHGKNLGLEVGKLTKTKGLQVDFRVPTTVEDLFEIHVPDQLTAMSFQVNSKGKKHVKVKNLYSSKGEKLDLSFMKEDESITIFRIRDKALLNELADFDERKVALNMTVMAYYNEPLQIIGELNGTFQTIVVEGNAVEVASKRPTDFESIKKQLGKLGGTRFDLHELQFVGDKDIFIPVGELNRLRRELVEKMQEIVINAYERPGRPLKEISKEIFRNEPHLKDYNKSDSTIHYSVLLSNSHQINTFIQWLKEIRTENVKIHTVYLEMNEIPIDVINNHLSQFAALSDCISEIYLSLPHVLFQDYSDRLNKKLSQIDTSLFDGMLIRTIGQLALSRTYDKKVVSDYNIHILNTKASLVLSSLGVDYSTLSLELNKPGIREIHRNHSKVECVVYGKTPLMHSANCLYRTRYRKCSPNEEGHQLTMKDRKNAELNVHCHCDYCYNTIYNEKATYLLDQLPDCQRLRVEFTTETEEEVLQILNELTGIKTPEFNQDQHTRGHYKRGVL